MRDDPFDTLARTLAMGASRRQALWTVGGALVGALVASPARQVLAQGNSACARFCAATFGAETPAAGQCTSDAAHGRGLCYTCGPASAGGTKPICCPRNPNGTCPSSGSATCCAAGQSCVNGVCCPNCFALFGSASTCCPPGNKCCHVCSGTMPVCVDVSEICPPDDVP
jgi:hypothetical protein